jgi:5-methylcytosine-specific restriction endonuclease McrA
MYTTKLIDSNQAFDESEVVTTLLADIGIKKRDFLELLIDVLEKIRIDLLNSPKIVKEYLARPDGLELYQHWVEKETKRKWSFDSVYKLWEAIRILNGNTVREPIPISDRLYMCLERALKCFNCGKNLPLSGLQIHHKQPVTKGGKNKIDNYEWCCPTCNKKIGNKFYWRIGV